MRLSSKTCSYRGNQRRRWKLMGCLAVGLSAFSITRAELPQAEVNLSFDELAGPLTVSNDGTLGGDATIVQPDGSGYPVLTNLVPSGPLTPADNQSSLDFGAIAAGQFGRAVDLVTVNDPNGFGSLGPLDAFTICGWLNARDLTEGPGGNRIAFALDAENGNGFDLVQAGNGSLRIGINQWPDGANGGGPSSSPGKIKADPQASETNWIFFAVTYDSALTEGNLKYYFGTPQSLVTLDSSYNYTGLDIGWEGAIVATGPLTIGNFGSVAGARTETGGASRVFRGLIDELKIYKEALDFAQLQQAQLNGELPPVPASIVHQPASVKLFAGQPAVFSVEVAGAAPFTFQWQRDGVDIPDATNSTYTLPSAVLGDSGATFRVKTGNALTTDLFSDSVTLTVVPETGHKVSLSFSDSSDTVTNTGNLGGNGIYSIVNGYPTSSQEVPAGPFAPAGDSTSVDFGVISADVGGRAIDLTNSFNNSVGPMQQFTLTGWLNCKDIQTGGGGNRILFALASAGGAGFDLVQLADGTLQLGVNEFPDSSPAMSSPGRISADASGGANNWVFFAVTYDGTASAGNVSYYFGSPTAAATLDSTIDYARGPLLSTGPLTIGNFGKIIAARNEVGASGSRTFRGLMDEINVFNHLLTEIEIQAAQKAPPYQPAAVEPVAISGNPENITAFTGETASFTVGVTGTPPLRYQWWTHHEGADTALTGMTNAALTLTNLAVANSGDEFWVVISNAANSITSGKAALTVLEENNHKVFLSFSEGSGTNTANLGNIGGIATFTQTDNFPVFSTDVPNGAYAPSNNTSSVDFGTIEAGQGGRAIDLTGSVIPKIGAMQAFTLTGWLNCKDLQVGPGGNRILFNLVSPAGAGFDLVQYPDGTLHLGVNAWADSGGNPISSPLITEDPLGGPENWVFFAVTYDGTLDGDNVNFFFGSPSEPAALDVGPQYYPQGTIKSSGTLTVGNFSSVVTARTEAGSGGSRNFRGLMDELQVFNRVLSLDEIQTAQTASGGITVQAPQLAATLNSGNLVIRWNAAAPFKLQHRPQAAAGTWIDESTQPVSNGTEHSVTITIADGEQYFRLVNQEQP